MKRLLSVIVTGLIIAAISCSKSDNRQLRRRRLRRHRP